MTSEILYKKFVTDKVCNYIDEQKSKFAKYQLVSKFDQLDFVGQIEYANQLSKNFEELQKVTIDSCAVDVLKDIKDSFASQVMQHIQKEKQLDLDKQKELESIDSSKSNRIKDKERELEELKSKLLLSMKDVTDKHSILVSLKPELENLFKIYGLSTTQVSIDYEEASLEDLSEAIDIAIVVCKSTVQNKDLFSKLTGLLYLPAVKKFDDPGTNTAFQVSWLISLLLLSVLGKPYVFGTVGLMYIVSIFGNMYKVKEKEELLSLAYSLTEDLNFDKFIDQNEDYIKLCEEIDLLSIEDTNPLKIEIEDKYIQLLLELAEEDPRREIERQERAYVSALEDIGKECQDAERGVLTDLRNLVTAYKVELEYVRNQFKKMKANSNFLGSSIASSKTLSTKFKLGTASFEGDIVAEATQVLPLKNIVFTYKNDDEKEQHLQFMKLLLCNAISNVREKHLNVTVYDNRSLGRNFSELYNREINFIQPQTKDFRKLVEDLTSKVSKNQQMYGNSNIQEYNKEAEKVGKVTLDYNLTIIISTEENIYTNPAFREFLDYSASDGSWIWILSPDESTYKEREVELASNFYKGLPRSRIPGLIDYLDGTSVGQVNSPATQYKYTDMLGRKTINSLLKAIDENSADVLDYESGFRTIIIPDDKVWSYSTRKGIEINFGYQDGDPSKPYSIVLGDMPVHGLGGGSTGSGKSGMIDLMLANLFHKYSPEELEMVMIDFKNVEFKKYTDEYLIPHAKILAGTKDGEYALSVFDYLIEEMDRRVKHFGTFKLQNIEQYNNLMESQGRIKDILPRVLFLIDEYQVMFELEDKIVEQIKTKIKALAKLARFAGCHMYFISQSMTGTVSADVMDQFHLRTALRGSPDMSMGVLGNKAASEIKEKIGYMYSNTSGGNDANDNRLWRIPFASNSYIKKYMLKLNKKVKDEGRLHRQASFYDESRIHTQEEMKETVSFQLRKLQEVRSNIVDPADDPGDPEDIFFLGERTRFSINRMLEHFRMLRKENENAIIVARENETILNMVNTFIENMNFKQNSSFVAHCADKDTTTLLDLANKVSEDTRFFVEQEHSVEDLISWLESIVADRQSRFDEEHKPFYFFAIYWDMLDGIGRGDTYRYQERLKALLRDAGKVHIHFVMFVKDTKEFYRNIKPFINHKIVSAVDETESYNWLETNKGKNLATTFAIYNYAATEFKFKIYNFPVTGKLVKREVVLTY